MRLEATVLADRTPRQRLFQGIVGKVLAAPPDIFRTVMHRPDLFGGPHSLTMQDVMRGPSSWTVGERELFAAALSRAHGCPFCSRAHENIAAHQLGKEKAGYDPGTVGSASRRVQAALALVEAFAREAPLEGPIERLRKEGASDEAIEDVIDVAASFTIINRVADALQFAEPKDRSWRRIAPMMIRRGYRVPGWKPKPEISSISSDP